MNQAGIFVMLSQYNTRMNCQLLDVCANLSQEELTRDSGTFFRSVMDYWNHIMFGDLILLGRLRARGVNSEELSGLDDFPTAVATDDTYFAGLSDFRLWRQRLDDLLMNWCATLTPNYCEINLSFTSTQGDDFSIKASDLIHHIFQHQTHHRGQLTAVLSKKGLEYGCTDLPWIVPEGSQI